MDHPQSQFILFGASMTEWSFDEKTEGFGWFLQTTYHDKVRVVNEAAPQFILFGDSLTEWAFDEHNEGFGWYFEQKYQNKVHIQCEGIQNLQNNTTSGKNTSSRVSGACKKALSAIQVTVLNFSYTSTHLLPNFDRIIARATSPNAPRTLLFTIFLGANDACFIGDTEYVPLPTFEANIRKFVETILTQDAMPDTKIVLITPPPINIPSPDAESMDDEEIRGASGMKRQMRGYKTYMSKKRYAERIMQIAQEYEETGRVVGLDFWGDLVGTRLLEVGEEYDEERLPGSGLYGAKDFGEGYFTDGLHLDKKGYNVLSRALYEKMLTKWPELAPDRL